MVGTITVTSGRRHGAGLGCGLHRVPRQRRCVDQEDQHGQRLAVRDHVQGRAEGNYAIEYRSADKAGNVEATSPSSFTIKAPDDSASADANVIATVPLRDGHHARWHGAFGAIIPGVAKDYDATHHGDGHVQPARRRS